MIATLLLAVTSLLFSGDEAAYIDRIDALRTENNTFLDRTSDRSTVSSAATGFGVLSLAHASHRGHRDRDEVVAIANSAFEATVGPNPKYNRGWLPHFTDLNGRAKEYSEVSTIDTAIFYAGMLRAAELLEAPDLTKRIRTAMSEIDLDFVIRDGAFLHGFYWTQDAEGRVKEDAPLFLSSRWNDSSEGLILYKLFDLPFPLQVRRVDYPLFVYMYPLCFFDDPDYEGLLQEAIDYQVENYGYWGVTSTDGPNGYVTLDKSVVSPVLIGAVSHRYPQYAQVGEKLPMKSSVISVHLPTGWVAADDLTIDLGSAYVLYAKTLRQRKESDHNDVLIAAPPLAVGLY